MRTIIALLLLTGTAGACELGSPGCSDNGFGGTTPSVSFTDTRTPRDYQRTTIDSHTPRGNYTTTIERFGDARTVITTKKR